MVDKEKKTWYNINKHDTLGKPSTPTVQNNMVPDGGLVTINSLVWQIDTPSDVQSTLMALIYHPGIIYKPICHPFNRKSTKYID